QPAIVAVLHVGVDLEAQLLDVEGARFLLVAHVEADHLHALVTAWAATRTGCRRRCRRRFHGTSLSCAPSISSPSCLRFSETAIVRSGRRAALRKQAGSRSSAWAEASSCSRTAAGVLPVVTRNVRPKVPR